MLPDIDIVQGVEDRYLCFRTGDVISTRLRTHGVWGALEANLALMVADGFAEPVIVDIGANLGTFTVPVARALNATGGIVHAFEPQRIVFQQLCGNVVLNRLDNVYTHHLALGAESKTIALPKIDYARTQNIGAVSLLPEIRGVTKVAYSDTAFEKVGMRTLDSLDLKGSCVFVKIDVEGYESEVIEGAVEFLARNSFPSILFEEWRKGKFSGVVEKAVGERQARTRALLAELGYELLNIELETLAQHPQGLARVTVEKQSGPQVRIIRER